MHNAFVIVYLSIIDKHAYLYSKINWKFILGVPKYIYLVTVEHQYIWSDKCSIKHDPEDYMFMFQIHIYIDAFYHNITMDVAMNINLH